MNNEKMGQLISELRKSNNMTQKDLAARLNLTDKAVSKWERGLSCPDVSLLMPLADVLGITVGELLNGEKNGVSTIDQALQYADQSAVRKVKSFHRIYAVIFSVLLFTGMAVCVICDLAITGRWTWSLYPVSSIVFAWLVFFPVVRRGTKGIRSTMTALSLCIVPFLWILSLLVEDSRVLAVGIRAAAVSIGAMWVMYGCARRLRARKCLAAAVCLLLVIPALLMVNISLSGLISEPVLDVWDVVGFLCLTIVAGVLWGIDLAGRKKIC